MQIRTRHIVLYVISYTSYCIERHFAHVMLFCTSWTTALRYHCFVITRVVFSFFFIFPLRGQRPDSWNAPIMKISMPPWLWYSRNTCLDFQLFHLLYRRPCSTKEYDCMNTMLLKSIQMCVFALACVTSHCLVPPESYCKRPWIEELESE